MSISMAETIEEERYRWLRPVINKEMRLVDVAKICPHSIRSLKRWKQAFEKFGMDGLVPKSTQPKTSPNETPIRIKELVKDKRKETNLCAQKIHWRLEKEGVIVPVSTIGKILKDEGLVKVYRMKKIKYKHIKVQRLPGELVEIDVKHVPGPIAGHKYYQYTAIDTASRWRHLEIFDEETINHSVEFLQIVISLFPYQIKAIKTDNHATFTNYYVGGNKRSDLSVKTLHALDVFCAEHTIIHYLIDKGKPTQNGKIERSHGEDQRKFYERNTFTSETDLKSKIVVWNEYYNNLEHCSLGGLTPNEVLYGKVPDVLG
jgi:transposase InsO family protein